MNLIRNWIRWIIQIWNGHLTIGPVTFYGRNAMHYAINIRTKRWGYICFHPPVTCWFKYWGWYLYFSPNATPWAATFTLGSDFRPDERKWAKWRKTNWGHGYDCKMYHNELMAQHT